MLYLVQHGEALSKEEDPERPLTEQGAAGVRGLGRLLRAADIEVDDVFDSGKLRARQTAEILVRELVPERGPEEMAGLGATDPVAPVAAEAASWTRRVMLVGHLPFVARLAATLVGADEERPPVAFTPGTIVALEAGEAGTRIGWMLRPELVRAYGG